MEVDEALILLATALACKNKAYADLEEIKEIIKIKEEEYNTKIKFETNFQNLLQQGFIHKSKKGYTILNCPSYLLIEEIEERLKIR